MKIFDFRRGQVPLLISIPHAGRQVPAEIESSWGPAGQAQTDTDWFVDRLYDLPIVQDCSQIVARVSRYVVDLNRSADDDNLYPGQNTTGLCSPITFAGQPIYLPGREPEKGEIERRVARYWQPYHDQIQKELQRLATRFERVVLFDAHSIASQVPRLFPGVLPDLNWGTNRGQSGSPEFLQLIDSFHARPGEYTSALNGRFVGGYITRHYGQSAPSIHAVQLELSQANYLDEASGEWDARRAGQLQQALSRFLDELIQWSLSR